MGLRRHHYERAFEHYLGQARIPYIAFEEARDALLASPARLHTARAPDAPPLKSFDFLLYTPSGNLLVDVKGRRIGRPTARLESWATEDDVLSLTAWADLFGDGFSSALAFVYWCDAPLTGSMFENTFEHDGRWYALRAAPLEAYAARMRQRSPKWRTVDLAPADFDAVSMSLTACCDPATPVRGA
jgi:hypothetical protein